MEDVHVTTVIGSILAPLDTLSDRTAARTHTDGIHHQPQKALTGISCATTFYSDLEGPNLSLLQSYVGAPVAIDAQALEKFDKPDQLFSRKLWHGAGMPSDTNSAYFDTVSTYGLNGPDFKFWKEWYEGFLEGVPMDWELQRRVMMLDEKIWSTGPKNVAVEIERIRARMKLQNEIDDLKEELRTQAAVATSGHNQGPALDDNAGVIQKNLELVWPILEELEEEAEKDDPDSSLVKILAQKLWDISIVIAKYCGGKADIIVTKSAEAIGDTGTKLLLKTGVAAYVGTNESVQSVAKAAWAFAKVVAGG